MLLFSHMLVSLATIVSYLFLLTMWPCLSVTNLHTGRKSFIIFIRSLTCYAYPSCICTLPNSTCPFFHSLFCERFSFPILLNSLKPLCFSTCLAGDCCLLLGSPLHTYYMLAHTLKKHCAKLLKIKTHMHIMICTCEDLKEKRLENRTRF